ncbi:MAG: hypothetical protein ABI238_06045 [Terrimesophilobacter sp.]
MNDERDSKSSGTPADDDGLDAWLAANFPPKPHEPVAPQVPAVPEPLAPTAPAPTAPADPAALAPPLQPENPVWPPAPPVSNTEPPVFPPMAEELGGLPPAPEFPPPPTEAFVDVGGASGIDSLFGETKFRDYEEDPGPSQSPFVRSAASESGPEAVVQDREAISSTQKALIWIAGSLVAVLALLALFILGTKLPALLGPAPAVIATPSVTPTPTPTALPLGPVDPGLHRWNQLLGGECIDPYVGPWENEYTVVDCSAPHPAQLVTRGTFSSDTAGVTGYPGMDALQSQVNLLCTSPRVVDYAKAKVYSDIQFQASFAVSADEWNAGNHDYYCFLSRSTGGSLTGSVAVPQVAPTPTPAPSP